MLSLHIHEAGVLNVLAEFPEDQCHELGLDLLTHEIRFGGHWLPIGNLCWCKKQVSTPCEHPKWENFLGVHGEHAIEVVYLSFELLLGLCWVATLDPLFLRSVSHLIYFVNLSKHDFYLADVSLVQLREVFTLFFLGGLHQSLNQVGFPRLLLDVHLLMLFFQ